MSEIFEVEPEYGNSLGRVNITGYDGTKWKAIPVDHVTGSLDVVEYEHHEIHDGRHFVIATDTTTAASSKFELAFTTAAITRQIHMVVESNNEAEAVLCIREAATFSNTGLAIAPTNNNRSSAITSTALVTTCSATSAGTVIMLTHVGSGKAGGDIRSHAEYVFKTGTTYVIQVVNETAQGRWHSVQHTWYEHIPVGNSG